VSEARFRRVVLQTYRRQGRVFPWRETRDPYEVLVGEVLLQRTRGEPAIEVYRRFLDRWPDERALARARTSSIASVIRPLGLVKRARMLKALGAALVELGRVPQEPEELLRLPGVGPYAAHSVPVFAAGRDLPVVDWVIARVLCRYFGLPSGKRPNTDGQLWELAAQLAAKGKARELWLGTLDFAAAVCKPHPLCERCPLQSDCSYYQGG
jgi:A/G-specific adenine glycosylase